MVKVLVVEDEASIREMIALNLRLAGMEAVEADSAEAALPLLEQKPGCENIQQIYRWYAVCKFLLIYNAIAICRCWLIYIIS